MMNVTLHKQPTLEDIIALYTKITGKQPTEKDRAECEKILKLKSAESKVE